MVDTICWINDEFVSTPVNIRYFIQLYTSSCEIVDMFCVLFMKRMIIKKLNEAIFI